MRASSGMTLIEVLIVGGVLMVFMTMVGHTLVTAFHSQRETSKKTSEFRDAAVSAERMGRELRMCKKLYSPDPTTASFLAGTPYTPEDGVNSPVAFRRFDHRSGSDVVVGYTRDPGTSELIRINYQPGYDPADAATQVEADRRVLARGTKGFELYWIDPAVTNGTQLLGFRFQLENVEMNPAMEVRINKL